MTAAGLEAAVGTWSGLAAAGEAIAPNPNNAQATITASVVRKCFIGNVLTAAVVEYTLTGTQKGLVFGQYPTAGMTVSPGTIVGILVSNGPASSADTSPSVSVPSVVGQTKKNAAAALTKVKLGNTTINWSGTGRPAGEVVGQAPEAGSYVPKRVSVILFVSNGK